MELKIDFSNLKSSFHIILSAEMTWRDQSRPIRSRSTIAMRSGVTS